MNNNLVNRDNKRCNCCSKHVPLPHLLHEVNGEYVCPTSYTNMLSLLSEYRRHNGRPPGTVRKFYSEFVQRLAEQSWTR